jgi:hypothetical protein
MLLEALLRSTIIIVARCVDASRGEESCVIHNKRVVPKLLDAPIRESCPAAERAVPKLIDVPM